MAEPAALADRSADRRFFMFNAAVSLVALTFLAWLLYVRRAPTGAVDVTFLPAVNASLNATAAALLVGGWLAIRRGNARVHRYFMIGALAASALFLGSYVTYHWAHGDTHYAGPARPAYLALLASHVLLSIAVLPLALTAVWFAARRQFARHKKVTRIALPIWLYVSVTGVLIFFVLRAWGT
jgi:putative membrane protein